MLLAMPTIHRNGTDAQVLLDGALDAAHKVREAIEALQAASPNARDYYVQGADAFSKASAQHADRVARLNGVLKELSEIAEVIADQT